MKTETFVDFLKKATGSLALATAGIGLSIPHRPNPSRSNLKSSPLANARSESIDRCWNNWNTYYPDTAIIDKWCGARSRLCDLYKGRKANFAKEKMGQGSRLYYHGYIESF